MLKELLLLSTLKYVSVPDWDNCQNRISGTWKFGQAPKACEIKGPLKEKIESNYKEYIFDHDNNLDHELHRYTKAINILIENEVKKFNFKTIKEKSFFLRALKALVHQESYWTHYREVDGRLYLMRGDKGHGYGLTQVDDRWHNEMIKSSKAIDIKENLSYTTKIFYRNWNYVTKLWCVRKKNLKNRARASYSAYNGGRDDSCRFKNLFSKWRRNDQGFKDKFERQEWLKYL